MKSMVFTLLLFSAAVHFVSCSAAGQKSACFAAHPSAAGIAGSRIRLRHIRHHALTVEQRPSLKLINRPAPIGRFSSIISSRLAAASNGDIDIGTFDIDTKKSRECSRSRGIHRFVPSLFKRLLQRHGNDNTGYTGNGRRQRMQKAVAASLAFLHLAVFRLRPSWATTLHDADQGYANRPVTTVATSIRRSDTSCSDIRKIVSCKTAVSLRPGVTMEEVKSGIVPPEAGAGRAIIDDFDLGGSTTDSKASTSASDGAKLSRRERRALKKKQRQQKKKWEEYGEDDEDDMLDEDYTDEGMSDFGLGTGTAAAGAGSTGSGPSGGRMTAPAGAEGISDKARSNIQAKVIIIAGGGYMLSCFGYEGFQWNKEQKKVETSIEILSEQAKELGLVGMNETNATATDEEIADELSKLGNATDTAEGDEDGEDGSDDDGDDDGGEPEPPTRSRRPRKPIRPSDDDDHDGDSGNTGGAGDGRPSADDLDRLNRMFKK